MKEREQDLRAFPHSNKAQPVQATRYEYKEKVSRKRHEYCHGQRVYDFPLHFYHQRHRPPQVDSPRCRPLILNGATGRSSLRVERRSKLFSVANGPKNWTIT